MATRPLFSRLYRSQRGAVLVEFALVLPLLLVIFAIIIEGGRMMWTYQTAISGVRDATRYIARVVATDECPGRLSNYPLPDPDGTRNPKLLATMLASISESTPQGPAPRAGVSLYPSNTDLTAVTASLDCSKGAVGEFRVDPVPVVTVTARVRIDFPFEGLFDLAGGGIDPFVITTITDQSRVFGS